MTDINKIKISRYFSAAAFWLTIIVLFFQSRGLELGTIYKLLSFYALCIVILEFPTGVIGDYFSHRVSVALGHLCLAAGVLFFLVFNSIYHYILVFFIGALGQALISGSDNALLYGISDDYKKDLTKINSRSLIVSTVSIALGGLIGKYNLNWPLYLTGTAQLLAALFVFLIKETPKEKFSGNIFAKAFEGLSFVKKENQVQNLLVLSGITGAFFISFKWLYNPYFESLNLDVGLWGILISLLSLTIALGNRWYRKSESDSLKISFGLVALFTLLAGLTNLVPISITAFFLLHLVNGFISAQYDVKINEKITNSIRASILSLRGLLIRLGSSVYILGAGLVMQQLSVSAVFILTGLIIFFFGSYLFARIQTKQQTV